MLTSWELEYVEDYSAFLTQRHPTRPQQTISDAYGYGSLQQCHLTSGSTAVPQSAATANQNALRQRQIHLIRDHEFCRLQPDVPAHVQKASAQGQLAPNSSAGASVPLRSSVDAGSPAMPWHTHAGIRATAAQEPSSRVATTPAWRTLATRVPAAPAPASAAAAPSQPYGITPLDHAGSALYSEAQLAEAFHELVTAHLPNPHRRVYWLL
jgi:hypothetical protein